jgi:hypothetical protein
MLMKKLDDVLAIDNLAAESSTHLPFQHLNHHIQATMNAVMLAA